MGRDIAVDAATEPEGRSIREPTRPGIGATLDVAAAPWSYEGEDSSRASNTERPHPPGRRAAARPETEQREAVTGPGRAWPGLGQRAGVLAHRVVHPMAVGPLAKAEEGERILYAGVG